MFQHFRPQNRLFRGRHDADGVGIYQHGTEQAKGDADGTNNDVFPRRLQR